MEHEIGTMALKVGELLKARSETIAVAESSSGGLISAALLGRAGCFGLFQRGRGCLYARREEDPDGGFGRADGCRPSGHRAPCLGFGAGCTRASWSGLGDRRDGRSRTHRESLWGSARALRDWCFGEVRFDHGGDDGIRRTMLEHGSVRRRRSGASSAVLGKGEIACHIVR